MARSFNPCDAERNFNTIVDSAVNDYPSFMANIWQNAGMFEAEILTNFVEFFEFIIDVKKNEIEMVKINGTTFAAPNATMDAPTTSDAAPNAAMVLPNNITATLSPSLSAVVHEESAEPVAKKINKRR